MRYTKKQLEELIGTDFCRMYRQFNDYVLDHYNVSQIWRSEEHTSELQSH